LADHERESETAVSILLGEREAIERAEATARRATGVENFDIVTVGSESFDLKGHNFRPQAFRRRMLGLYAWPASVFALVAIAMVANLHIYANRLDAEADGMEQKSGEWSQRARDLTQSVDQVNASIAAYSQISQRAKDQRGLSFALADLTELLPDSSYLTEMRYRVEEIRIAGFSDSAARLIALIEVHPSFDQARFNAPVVMDPTSNLERFDLSFRWRSGAQPGEKAGHEES
jgi:Tfp pilus assembly protein PilN